MRKTDNYSEVLGIRVRLVPGEVQLLLTGPVYQQVGLDGQRTSPATLSTSRTPSATHTPSLNPIAQIGNSNRRALYPTPRLVRLSLALLAGVKGTPDATDPLPPTDDDAPPSPYQAAVYRALDRLPCTVSLVVTGRESAPGDLASGFAACGVSVAEIPREKERKGEGLALVTDISSFTSLSSKPLYRVQLDEPERTREAGRKRTRSPDEANAASLSRRGITEVRSTLTVDSSSVPARGGGRGGGGEGTKQGDRKEERARERDVAEQTLGWVGQLLATTMIGTDPPRAAQDDPPTVVQLYRVSAPLLSMPLVQDYIERLTKTVATFNAQSGTQPASQSHHDLCGLVIVSSTTRTLQAMWI